MCHHLKPNIAFLSHIFAVLSSQSLLSEIVVLSFVNKTCAVSVKPERIFRMSFGKSDQGSVLSGRYQVEIQNYIEV